MNNVKAKVLTPNTYGTNSANINDYPKDILCLVDGEVEIWPVVGRSFTWAPISGQSLPIIHTKIKVISGRFVSFFPAQNSGSAGNEFLELPSTETFFLIDEYLDKIVDENNDYFKIK